MFDFILNVVVEIISKYNTICECLYDIQMDEHYYSIQTEPIFRETCSQIQIHIIHIPNRIDFNSPKQHYIRYASGHTNSKQYPFLVFGVAMAHQQFGNKSRFVSLSRPLLHSFFLLTPFSIRGLVS